MAALQQDDWALANLDEKDLALLNFARKLNGAPGDIKKEDVDQLRDAGLTDENIFDAVVLVAYFNFMNRIADGLGVQPEPEKEESYQRHLREVIAAQGTQVASKS